MSTRPKAQRLSTLLAMLRYRRPAGSWSEFQFISRYIAPLPNAHRDDYGNWHVTVDHGAGTPILFSCHTDTCHHANGFQTLHYDPATSLITATDSTCLGADDTAGCFLMRAMILAGVEGHYIFHYGEEQGCEGSRALAHESADFLSTFDAAIAFDRRGTGDIVNRQLGMRCCSDAFAQSLADALNARGPFAYAPTSGVYTDTAEYAEIIPECTNISVGYRDEHRASESLNARHLLTLLSALLTLRAADLTIARDPYAWTEDDDLPCYSSSLLPGASANWTKRFSWEDDTHPAVSLSASRCPIGAPFHKCCGDFEACSDAYAAGLEQQRTRAAASYYQQRDYLDPSTADVQNALALDSGTLLINGKRIKVS